MPHREHQDPERCLEDYLRRSRARPQRARVYHNINLASPGGWPHNHRIPDLVLLGAGRFAIDRNEYFEGAPTAVVEIHSAGDEAYEKLPFHAALGAPEVWIIHRDTRTPEIHCLAAGRCGNKSAGDAGWIASRATGVALRQGRNGKLEARLAGDEATQEELPEG
jgi:Uma2 family endonuclease